MVHRIFKLALLIVFFINFTFTQELIRPATARGWDSSPVIQDTVVMLPITAPCFAGGEITVTGAKLNLFIDCATNSVIIPYGQCGTVQINSAKIKDNSVILVTPYIQNMDMLSVLPHASVTGQSNGVAFISFTPLNPAGVIDASRFIKLYIQIIN